MIPASERSLHDLGLDYPYLHADYRKTWRKPESLVDRGLVKAIGTSNMTIPKLELLLGTPGFLRPSTPSPSVCNGRFNADRFLSRSRSSGPTSWPTCGRWWPNQDWRDLWDEDGRIAGW